MYQLFLEKKLLRFRLNLAFFVLFGIYTSHTNYAWATTKHTSPNTTPPISEAVARARMLRSANGVYDVLAAYLNLQRGNAKQAYDYLLEASKNYPESSLFQMAVDAALQQKSPDLAQHALQKWLTALPQDAQAHLNHLRLLLIQGNILETSQPLKQSIARILPEQIQKFLFDLPSVYKLAQQHQLALQVVQPELEAAQRNDNTRYIATISLARMYLATQQYQEALHILKHSKLAAIPKEKLGSVANRELPALVAITILRSISPTESNKSLRQDAQNIVKNTLRTNEASKTIFLTYIKALLEHKQYDQTLQQLRKFRKQYPKSLTGHMLAGAIALERENWKNAKQALLEYVALRKRGVTIETNRQKSSFVNNLISTKQTAQTDTRVYAMLARAAEMIHIKQSSAPSVRMWLDRAADTAEEKEVWFQHIDWLAREKHYSRAVERIQQLSQINETITQAASALMVSHIYERQKQYEKAIQTINTALRNSPNDIDLLYARGLAYDSAGKHPQAEQDYRRIIAINPKSSAALNALGYGLADRNERLDEAHTLILSAIKLDPNNGAIQDSVGWVKYRLGNFPEALIWLQKAFISAPQPDVAAHLGEVLWMTGKKELAHKLWKKALENAPENDVLLETVQRLAPFIQKSK